MADDRSSPDELGHPEYFELAPRMIWQRTLQVAVRAAVIVQFMTCTASPVKGSQTSFQRLSTDTECINVSHENLANLPAADTTLVNFQPPDTDASGNSNVGPIFRHKRGISYNDIRLANEFASLCPTCSWGYNWDSESYGLRRLHFIPMLWDDSEEHVNRFVHNVERALETGSRAIFSFNEPDREDQANMSPERAIRAHADYVSLYRDAALIGAPSISSSALDEEGISWLQRFLEGCDDHPRCHVDFCNIHWYSDVQYGDDLFEHLERARRVCPGKQIWLTEFGVEGPEDVISSWLPQCLDRLERLPFVSAYAYYQVSAGRLLTSEHVLSSYGEIYASY
ncbi:hypothetical protein S40288_10189 [Stachybotrys chartarum IBT 40288]|nr:hypothetical protein S40288_10189 [Stachybotrys chartarum IBT 40288]